MLRFLRYNSRHSLYFPGDGKLPRLDPISSRSHAEKSGKRTRALDEPLWLFRLRQRLFAFAGNHRCGRRDESLRPDLFSGSRGNGPDTWDLGPDGYRTCSYCGSIHPDDLMDVCRKTLADPRYSVTGTDKGYKFYLRQPGVRNASEGAIKFYTHHVPESPSKEDQALFAAALRVSNERFMQAMAKRA
jgi:hypothetical protein